MAKNKRKDLFFSSIKPWGKVRYASNAAITNNFGSRRDATSMMEAPLSMRDYKWIAVIDKTDGSALPPEGIMRNLLGKGLIKLQLTEEGKTALTEEAQARIMFDFLANMDKLK